MPSPLPAVCTFLGPKAMGVGIHYLQLQYPLVIDYNRPLVASRIRATLITPFTIIKALRGTFKGAPS